MNTRTNIWWLPMRSVLLAISLWGTGIVERVQSQQFPLIEGFVVTELAALPGPIVGALTVSSSGDVFAALLGDTGTHIYRVSADGSIVEAFGPSLHADPQALLVDTAGSIAPAGTVLAATFKLEGIVSDTQKLDLSVRNQPVIIYGMDFAPDGGLIFASAHTDQWGIYEATASGPVQLFADECRCGFYDVLVGPDGKIYASRSDGSILLTDSSGQILNSNWASGMGDIPWTAMGPGGLWGNRLFAAANSTGVIYAIDENGNKAVFASGFEHIQCMAFGPDSALYLGVRPSGRILKISPAAPPDSDGDGVPDDTDSCPESDLSETVIIGGLDSGVGNRVLEGGCTLADRIAAIRQAATNHGELVSEVSHFTNELVKQGILSGAEKGQLVRTVGKTKS